MIRSRSLILFLFLALAPLAAGAESIELRLLRTVQIGVSQSLTLDEIAAYARDDSKPYEGLVLANAALYVLDAPPRTPMEFSLGYVLDRLPYRIETFASPPGMPHEFDGETLAWTLVYAMVLKGDSEKALDVLEKHLSGSRFARSVVLHALRFIGGRRASDILQREAEKPDYWNLPEVLLSLHQFPFLSDLHERLPVLPPSVRDRGNLARLAQGGCSLPATTAAYFLGFLASHSDHEREEAELELLRAVARRRGDHCNYTRFFAVRSLALRSRESVQFWADLFRDEENAWLRAHITLIGYVHFEREFFPAALELVATEPSFYVRKELLGGNIAIRRGEVFRIYWDIWLTPEVSHRGMFPRRERLPRMASEDVEELLAWVESHPEADITARNAFLSAIAPHVRGNRTRRLLRLVNVLPERQTHVWVVRQISDPAALPLLRYWFTLEPPRPTGQESFLENAIRALEGRSPARQASRPWPCCQPTQACLTAWALAPHAEEEEATITSEEEALTWLRRSVADWEEADLAVEFQDSLERVALVHRRGVPKPERWEHLYGCWVRVDPPPTQLR